MIASIKTYVAFLISKLSSWAIYSSALYFFIPNSLIDKQIQALLFMEFFYGMLLYPIKISMIKEEESKYSFFMWSIFLSCIGIITVALLLDNWDLSAIILIISILLFPMFALLNAIAEKTDITQFVFSENKAAILSSIFCFFLFFLLSYLKLDHVISMLYRGFVTTSVIILMNIKYFKTLFSFKNKKIDKNILKVITGIDFLTVAYLLKSTIFQFISQGTYKDIEFPANTTKVFTIMYDPIAAIFGLFLRRQFILGGHGHYLEKTRKFFLYIAIAIIALSIGLIITDATYLLILVILFIYIAAFSNTAQLVSLKQRIAIIFCLIITIILFKEEAIPFYTIILLPLIIYLISYKKLI